LRVTVTVDEHEYEVEVGDLAARPIVATIEGTAYAVWPESEPAAASTNGTAALAPQRAASTAQTKAPAHAPGAPSTNGSGAPRAGSAANEVRSPLPGVIVSIKARPGMKVSVGDELLVLEAMKMKNAVRAVRAGTVAAVPVAEGQAVKHSQVLVRYEG
jgi:biotin carboxyl carrier protein